MNLRPLGYEPSELPSCSTPRRTAHSTDRSQPAHTRVGQVWHADQVAVEITVRYWAGARRAAGIAAEPLTATTVGDVRAHLAAHPGLASVSTVASLLVDGRHESDEAQLPSGAEVDVLPPFAGG